jgi:hypothetical protein
LSLKYQMAACTAAACAAVLVTPFTPIGGCAVFG